VKRTLPALLSALALSLFLGAGCRDAGSGGPAPIKIGLLAPFNSPPGEGIRNGVRMAVEEINAAGGIGGRKIEILEINTEYSAQKGLQGYQRLAGHDRVVAVLGVADDSIFPIIEQLQRYKVPMITTGAGADKLTDLVAKDRAAYQYFFRVMHKSSELGNATADFAVNCLARKHGLKNFAIMVEDDIWTKYVRDIWVEALGKNADTKVVFNTTFSSQTTDFSVIFQQIIQSRADYILDACSQVEAATYLKRWAAVNAPPIGAIPTGAGTQRYYDLIGDKGLYVCSVATIPSPENPLTDRSAAWWEQYTRQYGDPSYTSAYSYDAVHILAEALRRAGRTDADALTAALEQTDHRGAAARWVFGADHHSRYGQGYREIPIIQYTDPTPRGFKVVWPQHRATLEFKLAGDRQTPATAAPVPGGAGNP
jgi:branched-chain amino acid transport system substrate-binding protein